MQIGHLIASHLIDVILLAFLVYFIFDAVRGYHSAAGSIWQRMLAAGKSSATIVWARFTVMVAAFVNCLVWLADVVNAPTVATAITTYLKPSVVAGIMVTVALITELARRRTL
jgi:hypothetical protein